MSEKRQHHALWTRESMDNRYGQVYHHKHDKRHLGYRLHFKSHSKQHVLNSNINDQTNHSTGIIRKLNLQKLRKRLAKNRFH